MTVSNLGRLERVELRDIWLSGASDFTPWLARQENLAKPRARSPVSANS
jgi:hypothetical protein